jgi:copper chaperone CopZ
MSDTSQTTATFDVVGMTCDHCVHAVTQEVSGLPGVRDVTVDLVPEGRSHVHVTSDAALDRAAVAAAVEEAGYTLADPQERT